MTTKHVPTDPYEPLVSPTAPGLVDQLRKLRVLDSLDNEDAQGVVGAIINAVMDCGLADRSAASNALGIAADALNIVGAEPSRAYESSSAAGGHLLPSRGSQKTFRKKCHKCRGLARTYSHQESSKALIEHSVRASPPGAAATDREHIMNTTRSRRTMVASALGAAVAASGIAIPLAAMILAAPANADTIHPRCDAKDPACQKVYVGLNPQPLPPGGALNPMEDTNNTNITKMFPGLNPQPLNPQPLPPG